MGAVVSAWASSTGRYRGWREPPKSCRTARRRPLCPKQGPLEIRDSNASSTRIAKDLRQAETDRELMLAGISHELRTPLACMHLEIEMNGVSEDARQAIDEDLGQIDQSIGQLMEYARPAGTLAPTGH